jgi:EamA-like transporter family
VKDMLSSWKSIAVFLDDTPKLIGRSRSFSWVGYSGKHLLQIPLHELALQAAFQGVLVTIISLILYVRSIAILGASGGAAFGALVPALLAFLAIPLVGEWPSEMGWVAIVLISAGVYLTSGGPVTRTQRSSAPLTISQSTNSRIIGDRSASEGP